MRVLTGFHPDRDLLSFHHDVNRLFQGLSAPSGGRARGDARWLPNVDVRERDEAYEIRVDLPGIDPKGVKIEISGDTLSLRGERKSGAVDGEREIVHRNERVFGTFERVFRLGLPVDAAKIKATYRDGVLEIRAPKLEPVKTREIAIDPA